MPSDHPLPRQTDRILLRRLAVTDLEAFQAYRLDPELGRYQSWEPMPEAEAKRFLAEMGEAELLLPGRWCQIAIAEPGTGLLLGDIGVCLSEDQDEAEIGFTLGSAHHGKGFATEAVAEAIRMIFEQTRASRVKGITDARNQASINTLARIGMRRIDAVQAVFRGEPCVEFVYSLARGDEGSRPSSPCMGA